ncbi:MAG TPA: DUF1501 domain-containing protein [Pirellulales bacterium]|nr:DUF1501 domain-containing protein [Pirellulales bacterium]
MNLRHHLDVTLRRDRVLGRRHFLQGVSAAGLAAGAMNWTDVVSASASDLRRQGRACILLWMQGGPSQFETFDPKSGDVGGETQAIDTRIPGVKFADNLPHVAGIADQLAVVRSMTTKEGNHQRASFLMHTSYVPTATVHHPTMGSVVSKEMQSVNCDLRSGAACDLPSFVRIGQRFVNSGNGGLLGTEYDAFAVPAAGKIPDNIRLTVDDQRYARRLSLLDKLEAAGATSSKSEATHDHQKLYEHASKMVLSPQMKAFDLAQEPEKVRDSYGTGEFASGCLLARRLVESGVTFVEVGLGNWDTHFDNFDKSRSLCKQLDQPFAALVNDLRDRGMLDNTLVVWMGEFGRTPRVNPRGGRDHFPRAFRAALAGGGIRGGQVLGTTSDSGDEVTDRPVTEKDLFQTVYKSLGIDAHKENMSPIGRPIRIVDGGTPVDELFT